MTLGFDGSDAVLREGARWAVAKALSYAHDEGDPVGPWFEAALPGREAFCMRDTAHMTTGAEALGLHRHLHNMFGKFAASVAPERDWCPYWEIDRLDRPAPVDYRDDGDFWYNLPAAYDVIDACWRAYRWSGDAAILRDPTLAQFFDVCFGEFLEVWDQNGDGLPEGPRGPHYRGIPTYTEHAQGFEGTGFDVLTEMHAACLALAALHRAKGQAAVASGWETRAAALRADYEHRWWMPEEGWFHTAVDRDGRPIDPEVFWYERFPEGMVPTGEMIDRSLPEPHNVEARTYLPEMLYRYGLVERAFAELRALADPKLDRRDYPEVPFCLVGTLAEGALGVRPTAPLQGCETLSGLPDEESWLSCEGLAALGGWLDVRQEGRRRTVLTNRTGRPLLWRAGFRGLHARCLVAGRPTPASPQRVCDRYGSPATYVECLVRDGETLDVAVA
jgi:hypothetical protein